MNYPTTINNLIECFKHLPGIGERTAERLVLSLLDADDSLIDLFSQSLSSLKQNVKHCECCYSYTENSLCNVCSDKNRNNEIICVVENPKDVIAIEKIGTFHGKYHVLNGLISPINGKNPEDLNIKNLIQKVNNENVKEIIFALTPNIEGETTALYITKKLSNSNLKISKIAHGVPLGANMDYIDSLTLEMALENRTIISNS